MIDGATAALERHHAQQDHVDLLTVLYGEQAHEAAAQRILHERPADVLDLLADDLPAALGVDLDAFQNAIASGNRGLMAVIMANACDRMADRLVTDDAVNAEINRLKECDQ